MISASSPFFIAYFNNRLSCRFNIHSPTLLTPLTSLTSTVINNVIRSGFNCIDPDVFKGTPLTNFELNEGGGADGDQFILVEEEVEVIEEEECQTKEEPFTPKRLKGFLTFHSVREGDVMEGDLER